MKIGVRKHKSDRTIGVVSILLLILGLVVIYAIGPMRINFMNAAYGTSLDENYFFVHQAISVGLALIAFFVAVFWPYEKMRKLSLLLMVGGLMLCLVLVVLAEVGSAMAVCENGACRWIKFGGSFSLQPSEVVKLGLLMYLAQLTAKRKEEGKLKTTDFWVPFAIMSVLSVMFVVYFQQDLGSTVIVVAIIMAILFMSGVKMRVFMLVCAGVLVGGVGAIFASPHRVERLMTFTNAEDSDSYHIDNALMAIGTGGLTGVGVGNTVQATGYLPESINDSVFAVIGEAFGFLGLVLIIGCFFVLLFRIMKVYELRSDEEHGLIAVGVFAWVMTQVVVNICAMTGLFPLTGITLPLLSYGGTSMVFTAFALGLVMQLSRYSRRKVDVMEEERNMRRVSVSKRGVSR